jgi:hypothetical protein
MELKWVQCEVVGAGCSFYRVETVRRCERSHRYSTSGEWIVLISLVLRRGKDGAASGFGRGMGWRLVSHVEETTKDVCEASTGCWHSTAICFGGWRKEKAGRAGWPGGPDACWALM